LPEKLQSSIATDPTLEDSDSASVLGRVVGEGVWTAGGGLE
jgi:hypothetical protein